MKQIIADSSLVAACGLYCGACKAYLKNKCPGCEKNIKATWCKPKKCCKENDYATCAACTKTDSIDDCKEFNSFVAKIFSLIFRSDRKACIERIKEIGVENFAVEMADKKMQTIKN